MDRKIHPVVLGRWCRAGRCLRGGFGDGLGGVLGGATGTKQAVRRALHRGPRSSGVDRHVQRHVHVEAGRLITSGEAGRGVLLQAGKRVRRSDRIGSPFRGFQEGNR